MSKPTAQPAPASAGAGREGSGDSLPAEGGVFDPRHFHAEIRDDDPSPLAVALDDINNLTETALEAGDPIPPKELRVVAARQLRRLYGFAPFHYGVSSTPDGDIGIYACPKLEHAIALALFADGEALCTAFAPGEKIFESYSTVRGLTDEVFSKAGNLLKRALEQGG